MASIIPNVVVSMPSQLFTMARAFKSCANGSIYVGIIDADPTLVENQIAVYVENEDGTYTQTAQPIKLNAGGYPVYNGKVAKYVTIQGHAMTILDSTGTQQFYYPNVLKYDPDQLAVNLGGESGRTLIGRCESIAHLRTIEPTVDLSKIDVASYTSGTGYGGGEFVYDADSTAPDDGGYIIVTAGNKRWRRDIEVTDLLVTHFGAVPGTSDSHNAVLLMYVWAQANYPSIGVQFPAGSFYMTPINDSGITRSYVRFVGAGKTSRFGYFSMTTITSDKSDNFILKVKSRRTEIGGFIINGQNSTAAKSNNQGFFQNIQTQGQYVHFYNMVFNYVGGVSMAVVDTLDAEFFEIYSNYCWDQVIQATYSGEESWDHPTAIKLTEHNHQYYRGTNACLYMPRATQSLMNNVWVEHAFNGPPMNINNAQMTWDSVSVEDCHVAINAQDSRLVRNSENFQGQSSMDVSASDNPWLSVWEAGQIQIQAHGTSIRGQLSVDLITSRQLINNEGGSNTWYQLGKAYIGLTNQETQIEVFGVRGFSSLENPMVTIDAGRDAHGKAVLRIQRVDSGDFKLTADYEGSSCVLGFQCVISGSYVTVFANIAQYTRNASVFAKTNGPDRFRSGTPAKWWPDVVSQSSAPEGQTPQSRVSIHNRVAGIGANEDGNIVVKSNSIATTSTDGFKVSGFVSVVINGTRRWIPYYDQS